ncbi:glucose 1-dehydrogenase [Streptomyces rectiverticillatus]|uniref:SDR family NAD(P)-dependent oxidoreductase n=1 Tax=Streptomyces rectiverticillatus TaxID=173860 RepID=UPI0015C36FBE|nr:glucose 1-dehydrogenase [Streptomyces rectiverticillatus]QLE72508.1 glucose 1-dehydrogenase [Streptomyces rectiverticillatus]
MGKLDGRVVLITGAARGQGEQEARLFVEEGAKVVLTDVLDEQGSAVAKELGPDAAAYVHLDVGEEADWAAAVATAKETFGALDGLVNNAGILRCNQLTDTPRQEFAEVCRVNQLGAFLGMRAVTPELAAAGGGTIVNTSSYAALAGMPFLTSYAASKAAVLAMTRVAALELAARGIRVNAMCPGAIDTPMTDPAVLDPTADPGRAAGAAGAVAAFYRKAVPMGRIGRPEEVARLALYLTADDSSYVTGQHFVVDGGWLAGVPLPAS